MPWNHPYIPARNRRVDPEEYEAADRIYFMTIRAYQNKSPFASHELSRLMIDALREEQQRQNCMVFTYCLMPDHLHFLTSPRLAGISVLKFTDKYKGKTTNLSWNLGWHGKLWQPRSFDHIVRAEEGLLAISEYILNNPVRKGLVGGPEDWPWAGYMNPLPL